MVTSRTWRVATTIVATLALLAGCDSDQQGAPPPSNTPPSTDTVQVPPVDTPLDASAFEADPCASLTDTQRRHLMLDSGTPGRVADGVTCDYRTENTASASVFYSDRTSGLAFVYRMNEEGAWANWEPTEVDGHPAVAYNTADQPDYCSVAVGLSDSAYFSANAKANTADDRCSTAKDLAAAVLSTIKAGR
jgi:Protein of unknown function (DUF3558)